MPACFEARLLDLGGQPEYRVLEIDLEVVAQILAALWSVAPAGPASRSEQVAKAEELAQDIAEIGELIRIEPAASGPLHRLMPEAVVGGSLLRIAQDAMRSSAASLKRSSAALSSGFRSG